MRDAATPTPRRKRRKKPRAVRVAVAAGLLLVLCGAAILVRFAGSLPNGRRGDGNGDTPIAPPGQVGARDPRAVRRPPVDTGLFYRVGERNLELLRRYNTPYAEADLRHIVLSVQGRNSQSEEAVLTGRPTVRSIRITNGGAAAVCNPTVEIYPYVFPEIRNLRHIEEIADYRLARMHSRDRADFLFWVVRSYHIHWGLDWQVEKSDPLVLLNVLGHCMCVRASRALVTLAGRAGFPARVIRFGVVEGDAPAQAGPEAPWRGPHAVAEIHYDGSWHMYDPDFGYYIEQDGRVLSVEEIQNNPASIRQMFEGRDADPYGHAIEDVMTVYATAPKKEDSRFKMGVPDHQFEDVRGLRSPGFRPRPIKRRWGNAPFHRGDLPYLGLRVGRFLCLHERSIPVHRAHSLDYDLLPGERVTFFTGKKGRCYSGGTHGPPPFYANGVLRTPLAALGAEKKREWPYAVTDISAQWDEPSPVTTAPAQKPLEISFDSGQTWLALGNRQAIRDRLAAAATYAFWIRHRSGMPASEAVQLLTEFQVAPLSLPRLKEGPNLIRWFASERSFHPIAVEVDIVYTME